MHSESDYAGLETVSTHKSEIKILTLSSCFCKGHLVVSWALVMQVMMCTHHREALQKSTALQQSSSSPCFTSSKRVEQKSALQTAVMWTLGSIYKPSLFSQCPCTNTCELLSAIFQNYLFYYFENLYFCRGQNTASSH